MLINNTEALKSWLVVILEPLCDADSSALARYVLALLKKDKPEKELKRVMIEQLDVFLAEETKPFVERLFEAINSEEYLKTPLPTANNTNILSSTDLEEAEETSSTANNAAAVNTAATTGAAADSIITTTTTNDSVNVSTASSSLTAASMSSSSFSSGSTVTNVINQNDNSGDTINNVTAQVIDNNTATSSAYADKTQTPPIDESKAKDTTTERTSSSTSHYQSTSSHYSGVHHHHHNPSNRNEIQSVYGAGNSSISNTDRHHPRSASPPAARAVNAADKENQPRESRRRRASLRSRSRSPRSRSRSNERFTRRSRSPRDRRINEREKLQRQFRNKSPPMGGGGGDTRHDRRRGGGGGGGGGDRRRMMMNNMGGGTSDDRSPRFGGGDRRGSAGGGGIGGGAGGGNRPTNRSPISPRSRSPSLERGNRSGKRSPSAGRSQNRGGNSGGSGVVSSPDARHHHDGGEKRQRCRDFDEKGYCVRGETCPWDHGVNPVVFEGLNNSALISMSLREYNPDAPDLWSRSAPPTGALVAGATPGALMAGATAAGINPFTGAARPGAVMMGGPAGTVGFPQVPGADKSTNGAGPLAAAEYARTAAAAAAAAAAGAGFRAAAPMMPFPFNPAAITTPLQRELIPIPVVDASGGSAAAAGGDVTAAMQAQSKRRFELEDSVAIADGPTKRKIPAHSRLGPRVPSLQNCSLELRKVPRGLNTIAHLNNHFAKFGKIVNIQISYDSDPEAAIVTFSTHAEANVAYRSTEAVLNNRFIKVFWHTADPSSNEGNSSMTQQSGGRKNSQYHLNNVPAVPTPTADSAKTANTSQSQAAAGTNTFSSSSGVSSSTHDTTTTTTANSSTATTTVQATHVPPTSLRLKNNIPPRTQPTGVTSANFRKKQEEQVKAVAQLANGLRKRKQELLQSYVKQMKSALELVERCEPTDPQRGKTLETIKFLQETIDKLRKEIAAEQEQIQAQMQNQNQPPPVKKSKEQQKKELLDIELELFAQQQEGNDTTAIQKRLEELQRSLGIVPGTAASAIAGGVGGSPLGVGKPGHFMTGGRPIPRGRASYPEGSTRVDRRPKTIVVTGFSSEDAEFVLGHFKHFGEITKHDMDLEKPQLILSYATRITAEQAVVRGKLFKDKRLQIAWAPVVQTPSVAPAAGNKTVTPNVDNKTSGIDANKNQPQEATTAISSPNPSQTNSETDANNTDTLPELRLEDEEEDEESEDRSWRR